MQEQGSGGGGSSMLRTRPNTIIRGEVQGEYVVRGAKIKCSKALKEEAYDVVNLPLCHGVYSGKEPLINIKDMKDGENIVNGFGICSETGTPCVDEMKFHINWINRKKIRLNIEGEEAVTTNSFTMCSAHGGEITFEDSGQTAVYHPKNEKAKDELLTPKETSPYKTNNIQNTISDGFANVFSGLGTIKACESAIKYLGQVWKEAEGHPKIQEEIHNLANKIRKQILFIGELTSVDEEYLDSIRRQIESGDGADPLAKNDKEMSIANYEKIPADSIEPIASEELETEYNNLMKNLNEASIIFTKMQSKEEVENSQIEVNDESDPLTDKQKKINKFVSIAKQELATGFKENNSDNMTKYGEWYSTYEKCNFNGAPWCAMFVSWCANEADIMNNEVPRYASTSAGKMWYDKQGRYKSRTSGYKPMSGDVIFFQNKKKVFVHTGIVISFDPNEEIVYTIEGNKGDTIMSKEYSITDTYIRGYGVNGGMSYGEIPTISSKDSGESTQ